MEPMDWPVEPMTIGSVADFARRIAEGLPPGAHQYELRCHPDVYLALADVAPAEPWGSVPLPVFGSCQVVVRTEMRSGCWALYQGDEMLKQGSLTGRR